MNLNKVLLYGNLTRDPELKALPSGQQVGTFGIATNRSFKNKEGQQQEQTEFHNIVSFGRTAEVMAQYLKKGRPVFIEGRLQTRSWEKDGLKQYRTEVIVDSFQFGPSGESRAATAEHPLAKEFDKTPDPEKTYESHIGNENYPEDINPEDIPF